jgi:hydrogenase maturation protease
LSNPEPRRRTRKTLVLGLGNDILSDDSVGLRVADALQERLTADPNLTIQQTTEMGLALLDLVQGYEHLILIDAVQTSECPPGTIHHVRDTDLPCLPALSPHFLGIGETLALGRKLSLPVPETVEIFAIEVDDPFTVSTELTPELESQFGRILEQIEARLRGISERTGR